MSYPQQPYPQQPPPHWQGAGPGLQKPPSKGTTIASAIFALLCGLITAATLVLAIIQMGDAIGIVLDIPSVLISWVLLGLASLLLIIGGILLFARSGVGRFIVVAGGVFKLASMVLLAVTSPFVTVIWIAVEGTVVLLGVLAAVFAILPSTGVWLKAKKQQQPPQHGFHGPPPPGYGPPQGYPQQQQQQGFPPQQGYGPPRQW